MRVDKKHVPPIRLVRKSHPLPQLVLFRLAHARQRLAVLRIQPIVPQPHDDDHETQRRQRRDDADLARDVAGRLLILKRLRAQDVAHAKGNERQRVRRHLFRMARDVAGVPRQEQHKGRAKGTSQETRRQQAGLVLRDAAGIEADHESRTEDRRDDADEHDERAVAPLVREVADEQHAAGADGARGRVEDQRFLARIAKGREEDGLEVGEAAVWDRGEQRGEADEPRAWVAEGFEHLSLFEACVLGAAEGGLSVIGPRSCSMGLVGKRARVYLWLSLTRIRTATFSASVKRFALTGESGKNRQTSTPTIIVKPPMAT